LPEARNYQEMLYVPGESNAQGYSIPYDIVHANNVTELETHHLYDMMMAKTTKQWFDDMEKRSLIL